jgi:hypothetical protein
LHNAESDKKANESENRKILVLFTIGQIVSSKCLPNIPFLWLPPPFSYGTFCYQCDIFLIIFLFCLSKKMVIEPMDVAIMSAIDCNLKAKISLHALLCSEPFVFLIPLLPCSYQTRKNTLDAKTLKKPHMSHCQSAHDVDARILKGNECDA